MSIEISESIKIKETKKMTQFLIAIHMEPLKFVKYIARDFDWGEWEDWNVHVRNEIGPYQTCQSVSGFKYGENRPRRLIGWEIDWE